MAARKPGAAEAFVDAHREGGDEVFGIRDLAEEFGITPRAIRFYESKGLLSPRRVGGTRIYSRRDRARLQLILRGKAVGSSLSERDKYLELYGRHGEGRLKQLQYVVDKTDAAIAELEERRAQLDTTLSELRFINENCRRQIERRRRE